MQNITLIDIESAGAGLRGIQNNRVHLKDISFINFKYSATSSFNPLLIINIPSSIVIVENLRCENSSIDILPFLQLTSNAQSVEIKNGFYRNITFGDHINLIKMSEISNFTISNQTLEGILIPNIDDPSNAFLEVNLLDLTSSTITLVEDVSISNSQIALMNIRNIQNTDTKVKNFILKRVSIKDVFISFPRTLISTAGFESQGKINLIFDALTISGIEFRTIGKIFNFKHYLEDSVLISNGIFENIISGSLEMEIKSIKNLNFINKATFQNCTFTKIYNPQRSFITFSANALLEVKSSTFTNITSTNDNSGIISLQSNSIALFTEINFHNNSAIVASIFSVQSESQLT